MMTLRQIERLWTAKQFPRMVRELISGRPEAVAVGLLTRVAGPVVGAAVGLQRLTELGQAHTPFAVLLIHSLLKQQRTDGGWGDPAVTALVVRALRCNNGQGAAIQRGIASLAMLQKDDGLWPAEPIRRMPADPIASAFIVLMLAEDKGFQAAVNLQRTAEWFDREGGHLDLESAKMWRYAALRLKRALSVTAHGPSVCQQRPKDLVASLS
jgi:hypothetical protein